ncbi:uncharacterized protein K452DRAFT_303122 [Aplosporella prunicola CBS 121167]|uniref:Palmitoyltransferase n=1 Tax=Aplosporella prunicola CBS 121167 TaxID=1176127 RepID=A0A6A6AVM7_9PEZI|nr:uncharacterized protein K452DRAFT_303122 [Aplosporella prunicola CBS 121167]KAF2135999.1 hypothetical protein K452DRAFT_303122 [Aplosporella prunicola CBS 121167]
MTTFEEFLRMIREVLYFTWIYGVCPLPLLFLFGSTFVLSYWYGWRIFLAPCSQSADCLGPVDSCRHRSLGLSLIIVPSVLGAFWSIPWIGRTTNAGSSTQDVRSTDPSGAYYDDTIGRCLPIYDHWCSWFPAPIWGGSQKAYLLALAFLPVHLLVSTGFTFGLLAIREARDRVLYVYAAVVGMLCGSGTHVRAKQTVPTHWCGCRGDGA